MIEPYVILFMVRMVAMVLMDFMQTIETMAARLSTELMGFLLPHGHHGPHRNGC